MSVFITAASLTGCLFGPSKADIDDAKVACVNFYNEEKNKSLSAIVYPVDNWTKHDAIVVELAHKARADSTRYTAHICVYEKKKGTISLPGALHQGRWQK